MSSGLTRTASSPDLRKAALVVSTRAAPEARLQRAASLPDITVLTRAQTPKLSAEPATTTAAKAGALANDAFFEKTNDFEKAKASHSYGISSTIYYGLILPLKKMIARLTDDQKINLGLYQKHTALCSGIEKVQKAFKVYTAAKKTADDAPTKPETAREGARRQAIKAGTDLVRNYEDLIGLAIDKAEGFAEHQTEYLKDLHAELDKDTKGLILKTVNTIRPKIDIEPGLLDNKVLLAVELKTRYQKFVTEFVSKVHEAHCQTGDSSTLSAVTEAFIQRLAAIPELGELDDGLVLIELYDELSKKQADGVATTQDLAIQQFTDKIEALMNREQPITAEDLQNIQYNEVSLQSVKSIDVEELNALKDLRSNLKDVQEKIQGAQPEISLMQAIVEAEVPYSFDDVADFILRTWVDPVTLVCVTNSKKDGALGRLAKFYTETRDKLDRFIAEKRKIQAEQTLAKAARIKVLAANEAMGTEAKAKIDNFDKKIADETLDLAAQEKELAAFEKEIKEKMNKLAGEKGSELMKSAITIFKSACDTGKTVLQTKIDHLKASLKNNQSQREVWQEALDKFNSDREKLNKENNVRNIQEARALHELDQECLALTNHQNVVFFSGKDIKVITESWGSYSPEEIKIIEQLNIFCGAEARLKDLKSKELALEQQVAEITKKMTSISPLLTLNDRQDFVLNAAIFGGPEKAKIKTQLESKWVIAKKVTLEVAREIVKQGNAVRKQKADEDTGSHKSKLAYVGVVSRLELELEAREEADLNKDSLDKLVLERVNNLPPVVPKKPVKAKQPLSAPSAQPEGLRVLDESIDEDEYGITIEDFCIVDDEIDKNKNNDSFGILRFSESDSDTDATEVAEEVPLFIDEEM